MRPQISEFSYGFALTNELVGWTALSSAPIFPSLIEEGKAGGGYDVKLDLPGIPLFLQFKRSHCMTRRSAREFKAVTDHGGMLNIPYYRFPITESGLSDQHEMLMELDDGTQLVFYAAPRFHMTDEINEAWTASEVAHRSIFIAPSEIGSFDSSAHTVAYDSSHTWICSTPKPGNSLTASGLQDKILDGINADSRTLRTRISTLIGEMHDAEDRGRSKARERRRREAQRRLKERRARRDDDIEPLPDAIQQFEQISIIQQDKRTVVAVELPPERPDLRDRKPLGENEAVLRKAADIAARVFDSQLLIVQRADTA